MPRTALKAWMAAVLLLPAFAAVPVAAQGTVPPSPGEHREESQRPYRLLFLNLRAGISPWSLSMFSTCREEFERVTKQRVEMLWENAAISGGETPTEREALNALLRARYAGRVDFVVARSFSRHLPTILEALPTVPVILPMQDVAQLGEIADLPGNVYAVSVRLSPAKTARVALDCRPGARKIIVISGAVPFGRLLMDRAREEMGEMFCGAAVEYWNAVPVPELLTRVAALPEDHVVLFLNMGRDRHGNIHLSHSVVRELSAVSSVPVFGVASSYLDGAAVGGWSNIFLVLPLALLAMVCAGEHRPVLVRISVPVLLVLVHVRV